jgi:hypothetical protein
VAGQRRKKAPAKRSAPSDAEDDEVNDKRSSKRGRPNGAGNYTTPDIVSLLNFVEKELPLGQNGWRRVTLGFDAWAAKNGRPAREAKSLEHKFKKVCSLLCYFHSKLTI